MSTPKPEWLSSLDSGCYPSYDNIVASWGYDVLVLEWTGSYQGDIVVLVGDGNRRGFLVIGYGSCSGCDALEGVAPYDDGGDWTGVVALRDGLLSDIHWEDSPELLAAWMREQAATPLRWEFNESDAAEALHMVLAVLDGTYTAGSSC